MAAEGGRSAARREATGRRLERFAALRGGAAGAGRAGGVRGGRGPLPWLRGPA